MSLVQHPIKLVIAPHADDEALGCGGILDENTVVYICGIDESAFPVERPSLGTRIAEAREVEKVTGSCYIINTDTKVNYLQVTAMVESLECVIHSVQPEYIYIPHPGYNQDHRIVYQAALTALRPHDKNFFVNKVLVYEGVHDFIWSANTFIPNYFTPIDIDRKLDIFSHYKTQLRSYRSLDTIKQIAALRGAMSNVPYAEAYSIARWVE